MFSLIRYRNFHRAAKEDFYRIVDPLLSHRQVRRLDECQQHFCYTRLRHSMDVAYTSFWLTRLLGWNSRETARAALLHDLFFHAEGQNAFSLVRRHPAIAVENARQVCSLTPREEDIIRRHMWLVTLTPPRYREGYVVTFVDKFCAGREFVISLFNRQQRSVFGTVSETKRQ